MEPVCKGRRLNLGELETVRGACKKEGRLDDFREVKKMIDSLQKHLKQYYELWLGF